MSLLLGFLLQVFTFYPVLFIGSSLREPQLQRVFRICRDIRQQIETEHSRRAPPRYILLPMKFQEVSGKGSGVDRRAVQVEEEENKAFEELDIYVVRYNEIDQYHSGIESVLEDWCNLLPRQPEPGFEGPL